MKKECIAKTKILTVLAGFISILLLLYLSLLKFPENNYVKEFTGDSSAVMSSTPAGNSSNIRGLTPAGQKTGPSSYSRSYRKEISLSENDRNLNSFSVSMESHGTVFVNGMKVEEKHSGKLLPGDSVETQEGGVKLHFPLFEVRLGKNSLAAISPENALYLKNGKVLLTAVAPLLKGKVFFLSPHLTVKTCNYSMPVIRAGVDMIYGTSVRVDSGEIIISNRLIEEKLSEGEGATVSASGRLTSIRGDSLVLGESRDFLETQ